MRSLTVTVPMSPPVVLLPNQRRKQSHWRPIADATRNYRATAKYAAMNVRNGWETVYGPVELTVHVAYERRRRPPDIDASVGGIKAAIDGLVDARIIDDDKLIERLTITHGKAVDGQPATILTITATQEAEGAA